MAKSTTENMLDKLELDEDEIINIKIANALRKIAKTWSNFLAFTYLMDQNEAKYPVEKAKGNNKKYRSL